MYVLAKLTMQSMWLGQLFKESIVFHILSLKFENGVLGTLLWMISETESEFLSTSVYL